MNSSAGPNAFQTHVATLAASLDRLDYYTLLSLPREAQADHIKQAYHRVAGIYHPDAHRGAHEATRQQLHLIFKRMTEAYRVLHSYERRKRYDAQLARGGAQRLSQSSREKAGPRSPDAELKSPAGKRCFMQALAAIKRKDYKSAKRDLQLAMTYEGAGCRAVTEKLAEVTALLSGK